ncbi:sensor histidine kinase [Paraburkholderia sp. J11-2]|uniref:sensor histidine kinase n=1 Tax=Paraburkholderia sp. J11-2 TaxID=2805431 RepID=UPI002AB715A9|nr:ATP-binding protein [Paraburkholderia sp. J11-2]
MKSKARSLGTQLVLSLGIVLSIFTITQAISSYDLARVGVNAVLDSRLSNVAQRVRDMFEDAIPRHSAGSLNADDIVVLVWEPGLERPARTTDSAVIFDRDAAPGFSDQFVNREAWRVYTLVAPDNDVVQVAQRISVRQRMAEASAFRGLLPVFILIPAVWLAVYVCVRRSFRVLKRLGQQARAIDSAHLVPLSARGLPVELIPFVCSINRMIRRLDASMKLERDFIADAAHELRTPLTALKLQADNLEGDIAPSSEERFRALRQTIDRTSQLVAQLLQLARADSQVVETATDEPEVTHVVTSVVADLLPIARAKGIDIGAGKLSAAKVRIPESDLRALVKNLVDNALRYTPEGGSVDLRVFAVHGRAHIEVTDTGPGIPDALLTRVFDRFFRCNHGVEGSGLGLAIVRAIVQRHGGTISLHNRRDGQNGLRAVVTFALAGCETPGQIRGGPCVTAFSGHV